MAPHTAWKIPGTGQFPLRVKARFVNTVFLLSLPHSTGLGHELKHRRDADPGLGSQPGSRSPGTPWVPSPPGCDGPATRLPHPCRGLLSHPGRETKRGTSPHKPGAPQPLLQPPSPRQATPPESPLDGRWKPWTVPDF